MLIPFTGTIWDFEACVLGLAQQCLPCLLLYSRVICMRPPGRMSHNDNTCSGQLLPNTVCNDNDVAENQVFYPFLMCPNGNCDCGERLSFPDNKETFLSGGLVFMLGV